MMADKDVKAVWAELSRVADDQKMLDVVKAIEGALDLDPDIEPPDRRRLKVPYANTTPLNNLRWN